MSSKNPQCVSFILVLKMVDGSIKSTQTVTQRPPSSQEGCKLLCMPLNLLQYAFNDFENEMRDFSDSFMPVLDKGWTSE